MENDKKWSGVVQALLDERAQLVANYETIIEQLTRSQGRSVGSGQPRKFRRPQNRNC